MSHSFFKKSLAAANIKVTSNNFAGQSSTVDHLYDGAMDDEYDRQSHGGRGPRTSNYNNRGRGNRSRGSFNRGRYGHHDDRDNRSLTERLGEKLGFGGGKGRDKRGGRGGRGRGRGAHFYDNYDNHNYRGRRYNVPNNAPQWYQVLIPYGAPAGKDFLYESIKELLDIPFHPVSYKEDGKASLFYVELSFSSVEALKAINKRVTLPNGFKMMLTVKQQDPPVPKVIEGVLQQKLLSTMNSLYKSEQKVLDLSALHKNDGLKPECLPLNRPAVMTSVVSIVAEHIGGELVALNLSNNRLASLTHLEKLVDSTPNLQGLDLSSNPELKEHELEKIKGWTLNEINLQGTMIAKRYTDFNTYLTAVRKKFPSVNVLDGKEAPVAIGFEVEEEEGEGLPVVIRNYLGEDTRVQKVVTDFVTHYIKVFDSGDRSELIAAYHNLVTFSTSFWFYPDQDHKQRFDISNSRNLLKIHSNERNGKRIHYGKQAVVDFFTQEFTKTTHLLDTLNVDVVHQSPQMLSFTLTGLFEEPNPTRANKVTRLFSRSFTTIPQGAGLVIISEQFAFTSASPERRSRIVSAVKNRTAASTSTAGPSAPAPAAPQPSTQVDDVARETLIQRFMHDSGMNAYWSRECLESRNWDYAAAGAHFSEQRDGGRIPPEAYLPGGGP